MLSDLKFAIRTLVRAPLFSVVSILSLALGIGANTAIFTLMDQLMLRLLPVKDPDSLVMVWQRGPHNGSNRGARMNSYPLYQDYQKRAEPFAEVFCSRGIRTSLAMGNETELVNAELVSGNYYTALGVKPALGRLFTSEEDDRTYKGHPVVTLSHDYWISRFGGRADIVGQKIRVNDYPMTIVGVSAPGFVGLDPATSPQIRIPIQMKPLMTPGWDEIANRRSRWVQVFARLKPGYTVESAGPSVQGLFKQIREYEMTLPEAKNWSAYQRTQFMTGTVRMERAATGYSETRNSFSTGLVVLMAMVGLVLLIACANVANLLIARAAARQKEIAVRLSIGASRGQLIRQLVTESLVLSITGGICGLLLSFWTTRALLTMIPQGTMPMMLRAEPDARILGFSLLLSVVTGLIFGLLPALRSTKPDLWSTLKDAVGSIAGSGGPVLLRKGLVAAQVALSFLLLFGAGLFVRSLQNLKAADTGFKEISNLLSFEVSPSSNGYTPQREKAFFAELLQNVRSVPGVTSAGFATVELLAGNEWDSTMSVEGHQAKDGEDMQGFMNSVSPGYFAAMGVPIIEGREFDARDAGTDTNRAVVNRKFARHFFGDKPAVGRRIGWGGGPGTKLDIEIIGVSEDTLYEGPREGVRRQVFLPRMQSTFPMAVTFYVRTSQAPAQMTAALRAEVKKLDASLPVYDVKTLGSQLDETLLTERLIAMLSAAFGALATLLAALGLYGVMAFVVLRRTKEIGVRMALGATQGAVIWMVMREVLVLLGIGLAVGVPAAYALARYVSSQLFGIKAADPMVGLVTVTVLSVVAICAGLIPARRASSVDPMLALRYE